MSPTIFKEKNYRFFFFSREEKRIHIHVISPDGEAKFWVEPNIEIAQSVGYNERELNKLVEIIKNHRNEIIESWNNHFGS
jgi:UTP:GlnB (protein PII) uridylyltransferase